MQTETEYGDGKEAQRIASLHRGERLGPGSCFGENVGHRFGRLKLGLLPGALLLTPDLFPGLLEAASSPLPPLPSPPPQDLKWPVNLSFHLLRSRAAVLWDLQARRNPACFPC